MKHKAHYLSLLPLLVGIVACGNRCPDQCRCDEVVYLINCSYFLGTTSSLFESINGANYKSWFHLNLSQNNITHMSGQVLPTGSEHFLRALDLSYNNIYSITPGDLPLGTTNVLDLSHNTLTEVPEEFIGTLVNLESLNLSHNTLSILTVTSISRTLKHLDLSYNNITILSKISFLGLKNIRSLDVSNNRVSLLRTGIFDHLIRLELLNASYNRIQTIETGVFTRMLPSLYSVDLSYNEIDVFEPWPYLPENLVYFNLSYNKIKRFGNLLNWKQNLSINVPELSRHSIDLRYNNFTRWIGEDLGKYHKQGQYTVYDFIHYGFDLSQNPWFCDCHFYTFVKEVQESFVSFYIPRLSCASPLHLKGANILNLNPDVFVCNTTERCPPMCHCQFRPSERLTFVNCVGKELKLFPSEIPKTKIYLDISQNRLTKLGWTLAMQNISHLNLSHNLLHTIDPVVFKNIANLITVDLSVNKLNVLPQTIQLIPPEFVNLTGNVLLCSCNEMWIPAWLKLANSSTGDGLFCGLSKDIKQKTRVRDITTSLLKCHRDIAIIISCVLSILLVISITASVVIVKFRYKLKVFVYDVFKIHPLDILPSDTDATKPYDVYISCDEDDPEVMKIVKDTFLPKLEEGDPKFDVFVPLRQMALGDCKADAIIEAISSSRRFLALVTPGYLAAGGWSLYEFDQAHNLLVEDGSGKCIVVLLEDIEETGIQEEPLRSYITQKQFLQIRDKMFWAKIKYELPVKS